MQQKKGISNKNKSMKNMMKKTFKQIMLMTIMMFMWVSLVNWAWNSADKWTFNEYRYNINAEAVKLRNDFDLNKRMNPELINNLIKLTEESFKYLPDWDNWKPLLTNQRRKGDLVANLGKWLKYPTDVWTFNEIIKTLVNYLDNARIEKVSGQIVATPSSWNAPLKVTLRWDVIDPYGAIIPNNNYVWYINDTSGIKILWRKRSLNYTFDKEGRFDVFLAVLSDHKNSFWNRDVLPFSSRYSINVKERFIDFNIKINGRSLWNDDYIKFTPEEARSGLRIDATGSSPAKWSDFSRTEWDFWNWTKEKEYSWDPRIETVYYNKEWTFDVDLKLQTNDNHVATKKFTIEVRETLAEINATTTSWYIWDKVTFSARLTSSEDEENFSYSWQIVDVDQDKVIFKTNGAVFTYTFVDKWRFNILLNVVDNYWETDQDNQVIFINSRPPVADFDTKIPKRSEPNRVFLNGTKSYDPDFSDFGKLEYRWIIDGSEVRLENPNKNNSTGYYTFDSVWEHNVGLEVSDPDEVVWTRVESVNITSVLSVDFSAYPRVITKWWTVTFIANSPNARFFEWDFDDGSTRKWDDRRVNHKFESAGVYEVKLTVVDKDWERNSFTKEVYVWTGNIPFAVIDTMYSNWEDIWIEYNACDWNPAYMANRVQNIRFSWEESINADWWSSNLEYSWKIRGRYYSKREVSIKFTELGCYPVKLTVKDKTSGKTNSLTRYVKIENELPTFTQIDITPQDMSKDPVVLNVSLRNAKDPDGVIQSYLWYYYTNTDPEPQGFRVTNVPSTSFVMPKVTNDYYFAVVMTDNNEEKVNTEEISDARYFITLEWDNLNTPLVSLKINNSSISMWDDVIFNVVVKNVLWQDITNKSQFEWDFDGDGLYEQKTSIPNITYNFRKSGEFHPKVKATFKWISNTKNVTINVTNKLIPDFEYISIWKKVIFINKSIWEIVSSILKYDGKQVSFPDKTLVHEFEDSKKLHNVTLKIQEWTNVKEIKKRVITNTSNLIKARKPWLNVFTYPAYDREVNIVNIKEDWDKFVVYLWESRGEHKFYAVDYDIYEDTDLNWGKADDIDNKLDRSFWTGEPLEVKLNDLKEQTIRIFLLKDDKKTVTETLDIKIIKDYIFEVDVDEVEFTGLTTQEEVKIEKIKDYVKTFEPKYRLEASKFVEKLQASWLDDREKTETILAFEQYVDNITGLDITEKDDIINMLESFLVNDAEDNTVKNLAFNVVKNLIPSDIDGYSNIVDKLETIKNQKDVEKNRAIWSEILASIKDNEDLTDEDKLTIKSQLKVLIYNNDIPESEKPKEEDTVKPEDTTTSGDKWGFIWIIISAFKWIVIIVWIFVWIFLVWIIAFWIWYKVGNKDKNVKFADFIIEKTGSKRNKNNQTDVFDDLEEELVVDKKEDKKQEKKIEKKEEVKQDKKLEAKPEIKEEKQEQEEKTEDKLDTTEENKEESAPMDKADWEMPSWMRGAVEKVGSWVPVTDTKEGTEFNDEVQDIGFKPKTEEEKIEETTEQKQENLPSWLDINTDEDTSKAENKEEEKLEEKAIVEDKETKEEEIKEEKIEAEEAKAEKEAISEVEKEQKEEKKVEKKEIKAEDKKQDDDVEIPSWLKSSLWEDEIKEEIKEELLDTKVDEKVDNTEDKKEENDDKKEEEKIPSWLEKSKEEKAPEKKKQEDNLPSWLKADEAEASESENKEDKESEDKIEEKVEETSSKLNKEEEKKDEEEVDTKKSYENDSSEEIEIPSWLKSEERKAEEKAETEAKKQAEEATEQLEKSEEENIPSWLKSEENEEDKKSSEDDEKIEEIIEDDNTEDNNKEEEKTQEELPSWLKSDEFSEEEKTSETEIKEDKVEEKQEIKEDEPKKGEKKKNTVAKKKSPAKKSSTTKAKKTEDKSSKTDKKETKKKSDTTKKSTVKKTTTKKTTAKKVATKKATTTKKTTKKKTTKKDEK